MVQKGVVLDFFLPNICLLVYHQTPVFKFSKKKKKKKKKILCSSESKHKIKGSLGKF